MSSKLKNHGGRRPGAGRDPYLDRPARVTVNLDGATASKVEHWAHALGVSRSAAIRHLIRVARPPSSRPGK